MIVFFKQSKLIPFFNCFLKVLTFATSKAQKKSWCSLCYLYLCFPLHWKKKKRWLKKDLKIKSIFLPFYTQLWKTDEIAKVSNKNCLKHNWNDALQVHFTGTPCTPGLMVLGIPLLSPQGVCPMGYHRILGQSFLPLHWYEHNLIMLKSAWAQKGLFFGQVSSSLVRITREQLVLARRINCSPRWKQESKTRKSSSVLSGLVW